MLQGGKSSGEAGFPHVVISPMDGMSIDRGAVNTQRIYCCLSQMCSVEYLLHSALQCLAGLWSKQREGGQEMGSRLGRGVSGAAR